MDTPNFTSIGKRLASLDMWPPRVFFNVILLVLAEAGFFYEDDQSNPDNDTLRCAFCHVPVSDWSADDNPWVVHIQASPRCVHALFHFGVDEVQKLLRGQNEDFTIGLSPASILRQYPGEFSQRDAAYYTATDFRCYYCGFGGFRPCYDPWILHAQFTNCCHIILTKGEPYLEQAKHMDAKLPFHNAAGVMTRSMTKKLREVYVCRGEQNTYHRRCCGCGQTGTVTGALETSVQVDYRCAGCSQGSSGQT